MLVTACVKTQNTNCAQWSKLNEHLKTRVQRHFRRGGRKLWGHICKYSAVCYRTAELRGTKVEEREREGEKRGGSHLKHQPYQDENHQAEHDVRVVLNEELLAKERVALVPSSKCHVNKNDGVISALFNQSEMFWLRSWGVNFATGVRMRRLLKGTLRKYLPSRFTSALSCWQNNESIN